MKKGILDSVHGNLLKVTPGVKILVKWCWTFFVFATKLLFI